MKKKARTQKQKNLSTAINVAAVAVGMLMMAYASVPLYNLFCKVTGFAGTPKIAAETTGEILDKEVVIRFNADIAPDLGWTFKPLQKEVIVKVGEQKLVFYKAKNMTNEKLVGMSVYNVTPEIAGGYFNKIQCFCFDKQTIDPGEEVTFPVSFFIDPEITKSKQTNDIKTITLSYTFFKAKNS